MKTGRVCVCVFPHYNCVGQSHPSSHSAGIHLLIGGECWEIVGKKRNKLWAHKRGQNTERQTEKETKEPSWGESVCCVDMGTWMRRDN